MDGFDALDYTQQTTQYSQLPQTTQYSQLPQTTQYSQPPQTTQSSQLPQTTPKKNLSTAAKWGIGIGVAIGIGLIIFLVVYFVVIKKSNEGETKFGSIQVTDSTTRTISPKFQPGDTLTLKYNPTTHGFSGKALWTFSTDGGLTFPISIEDESSGNTTTWKIPDTVFSKKCVFKVADKDNTKDFVFSKIYDIGPSIILTKGPGTQQNTNVYSGTNVTITMDFDTKLTGLDQKDNWKVETSTNKETFSNPETQIISSIDLQTKQITWNAVETTTETVYYRISTTNLVQNKYPNELSAVSEYTVKIIAQPTCDAGQTGPICKVYMTKTDGTIDTFNPTQNVFVKMAFFSSLPTGITWVYNTGTGADVSFNPGTPTTKGTTATYTWTLPDIISTNFTLKATAGSDSQVSPQYTIQTDISFKNPGTIEVTSDVSYKIEQYTTKITFDPSPTGYVDKSNPWRITLKDIDNKNLKTFKVISATVDPSNKNLYTINWNLTQEDVGIKTGNSINKIFGFQVTGTKGTISTSKTVKFTGIKWVPKYAEMDIQFKKGSDVVHTAFNNPSNKPPVVYLTGSSKTKWFKVPQSSLDSAFICQWTGEVVKEKVICWSYDGENEFIVSTVFGKKPSEFRITPVSKKIVEFSQSTKKTTCYYYINKTGQAVRLSKKACSETIIPLANIGFKYEWNVDN